MTGSCYLSAFPSRDMILPYSCLRHFAVFCTLLLICPAFSLSSRSNLRCKHQSMPGFPLLPLRIAPLSVRNSCNALQTILPPRYGSRLLLPLSRNTGRFRLCHRSCSQLALSLRIRLLPHSTRKRLSSS